jgi:hypothetical protein
VASEFDVYQPPKADLGDPSRARITLYTPRQVGAATFVGTPVAGCILLASNQSGLGKPEARLRTILRGMVGTLFVLAVAFVLPDSFPRLLLPTAYTVLLYGIAQTNQDLPPAHVATIDRQPYWKALAIGFACLAVLLVPLVVLDSMMK